MRSFMARLDAKLSLALPPRRLIRTCPKIGVIINEHLTTALRKLRSSTASSSHSVDKALVSNILLSFLGAPRTDGTRFEMLGVLANILGWGENEREKAGLQRAGGIGIISTGVGVRKASSVGGGKDLELERSDETEVSFY